MKLICKVLIPNETNGLFIAIPRNNYNRSCSVIDYNFRDVSDNFNLSKIFSEDEKNLEVQSITVKSTCFKNYCYFELTINNKKVNIQSEYSSESIKNTLKLWKYHNLHFNYEYSECGKYFLKIWDLETFINRVLYSNSDLIKSLLLRQYIHLFLPFKDLKY